MSCEECKPALLFRRFVAPDRVSSESLDPDEISKGFKMTDLTRQSQYDILK